MLKSVIAFIALGLAVAGVMAGPPEEKPPLRQYIITLKLVPELLDPAKWTDRENALVGDHFRQLQQLQSEGRLILAGRTLNEDEKMFGIIILECRDEAEAKAIMEKDAAVKGGIMKAELFPFQVALRAK